jgi:hypothetical protein
VAITLKLLRNKAVGFIDWLGDFTARPGKIGMLIKYKSIASKIPVPAPSNKCPQMNASASAKPGDR